MKDPKISKNDTKMIQTHLITHAPSFFVLIKNSFPYLPHIPVWYKKDINNKKCYHQSQNKIAAGIKSKESGWAEQVKRHFFVTATSYDQWCDLPAMWCYVTTKEYDGHDMKIELKNTQSTGPTHYFRENFSL